jgi:hypothetical protein
LFYQHFGEDAKVWDANRVVLVADHFIQINEIRKEGSLCSLAPVAPLSN